MLGIWWNNLAVITMQRSNYVQFRLKVQTFAGNFKWSGFVSKFCILDSLKKNNWYFRLIIKLCWMREVSQKLNDEINVFIIENFIVNEFCAACFVSMKCFFFFFQVSPFLQILYLSSLWKRLVSQIFCNYYIIF